MFAETVQLARDLGLRVAGPDDAIADAEAVFVGYQSNPFPWVRAAALFVMSSVQEGFGNVILEAMACEVPVLAADCPSGPREILAPGTPRDVRARAIERAEFGILAPAFAADRLDDATRIGQWSQALHDVLADADLRASYREAGLRRIEDFRIDRIAALWESTLASLAE